MQPETLALLDVLCDLDDEVLASLYGITRTDAADGAPLDRALYAWRDAGCPDVPESAPTEPVNDLMAALKASLDLGKREGR